MLLLHFGTCEVYRIADAMYHFLFSFRTNFIAEWRLFYILTVAYDVVVAEMHLLATGQL